MSRKKACIITPDIIGPIRNGGIGTHCFYLAKFLAEDLQRDVTILFTSICETESVEYWREHYKKNFDIQFISEAELPPVFNGPTHGGYWFILRSQKIHHWLKDQNFDACYFQDWHANGFIPVQAKRTGQAYAKTALICMTHSSSEWIREGMQLFPINGQEDLELDYAERYSLEFADFALSPSEAMFRWAEVHGWGISQNRQVIPYLLETSFKPVQSEFGKEHLIFFGRLETRKGLEVFLRAVQLIAPKLKEATKTLKISFLGKNGTTKYGDGNATIDYFLSQHSESIEFEIFNNLSQPEALTFLTEHADAMVITPSLVDNLPFAVLECIELNLNIIAANTGGIPEMFSDDARLFTPNPTALGNKLWECITQGIPPLNKRYSIEASKNLWRTFVTSTLEDYLQPKTNVDVETTSDPLVSICIPYYNCGQFLPDALKSLESQTYKTFEVVLVDDGSTDAYSQQVFNEMEERYRDRGWLFVHKENGGPGSARNLAASKAQGDYLVFIDSDNAAEPTMLEKMVRGMKTANVDSLSCYYYVFDEELSPFAKIYRSACYMIGPCLEASLYENVLGDTNFIIKADTFSKVGGFGESCDVGHEDREFLAKLVIEGYTLDTIPDFLFLYRLRKEGFNRITSKFSNHMAGVGPLLKNLPWWNRRFILNAYGALKSPDFELTKLRNKVNRLQTRLKRTQSEAGRLKDRLEAMESSKFWKLRRSWFKVKRLLGSTEE